MIRKLVLGFLTSVQLVTLTNAGFVGVYLDPKNPIPISSLTLYGTEALSLPSATTHSNDMTPNPTAQVDAQVSKIELPSKPFHFDDEGLVEFTVEGNVATMTLKRPPVNAWSIHMFQRVTACANEVLRRSDIHVVIVKAEGERFGVGGDIKAVAHALSNQDYGFF